MKIFKRKELCFKKQKGVRKKINQKVMKNNQK